MSTIVLPPSIPSNTLQNWPQKLGYAHSKSQKDDAFSSSPEELVELALQTLQHAGMKLIEWRSILYRRMGVPVMVKDYHYLIADDALERAGDIVSELGLPSISPPSFLVKDNGDFYTKGRHFQLTRTSAPSQIQMFILFPLSFTGILPSELQQVHSLSYPNIMVPRPPAVFASIMRTMVKYRQWSPTRTTLESDLSELIGYCLYKMHDGYVDTDDDALCEELEVDSHVQEAGSMIQKWWSEGEWRESEEWMNDALYHIVIGEGDLQYLPWMSSSI